MFKETFFLSSNLYKKKIDKEGMEEQITTFMGNTTTQQFLQHRKINVKGGGGVESELLYALKQMKNGSALGCDGITLELLKMFWVHMSKLLALRLILRLKMGIYLHHKEKLLLL